MDTWKATVFPPYAASLLPESFWSWAFGVVLSFASSQKKRGRGDCCHTGDSRLCLLIESGCIVDLPHKRREMNEVSVLTCHLPLLLL